MPLISCQDALDLIAEKMRGLHPPTGVERVLLEDAPGRVLADSVIADRDQPPFPRSTRDGYAVRSMDRGARRLLGSIRAGEMWTGEALREGEAVEIMTGAPVPEGADAVVMLEHVAASDRTITVEDGRLPRAGENIVPRAAEARSGDMLLQPGIRITPAEVALAASVGMPILSVYAQPLVAVLATGDELVGVEDVPQVQQVRNSNSPALAALVRSNGGVARVLPPALDTRESLLERIGNARDAKMLLLTGGVSAGKYDLVEDVLLSLGAEFYFTGVRIQPGKPAVFGRLPDDGVHGEQWIFGLPGNPVSTQVTALLLAMPMLRALGGESSPSPLFAHAVLASEVKVRPGLTRFLPARLTSSLQGAAVVPTGWQGSGDLNSNARANCYLVVPHDVESLAPDSAVTVLLR